MIIQASERGGAKQLGLHITRTDNNEHFEIHQIKGFVSNDVIGALKEAHAVSKGTKCKNFLFSISLNPPETENVSISVFEDTINRIEQKNNLVDHPRVVVFHEKEGRRHAHAVWSRIDGETMTAKNLSHYKLKLRDISREVYMEQGWKMPKGLMNSQDKDPRNFNLAEWQQAKRMGHHAGDLKQMFQECWAVSDSRKAFEHVLRERGFSLAKGDRRGFVAVSHEGEVFSVARMTGQKTKDVNARLGKPEDLHSVAETKAQIAKDMGLAFKRHVNEAKSQKQMHMQRLDLERQVITQTHQQERTKLESSQKQRWLQETQLRSNRLRKGFKGLWDRLSGSYAQIRKQNEYEAYQALQRDQEQKQRLIFSQLQDRQVLQKHIKEVRKHYADLLLGLRGDIKKNKDMAKEPVQEPKRKRANTRVEQAQEKQTRSRPEQPKRLTPQERLQNLRSGKMPRDRGPDRER